MQNNSLLKNIYSEYNAKVAKKSHSIMLVNMPSLCCTPEPPDYNSLSPTEKQRFGYLVIQFMK
jgi:hypothetical protein